jgi:hypothetical protein
MKKLLITVLLIGIVAVLGAAAWWYVGDRTGTLQPPVDPIEFPIAGPNGGGTTRSSLSLPTQQGTIVVNDFLTSAETYEDPVNPGYYYLGNRPSDIGTPDPASYHILFIKETAYFNVVLLREPIGAARISAEQYLMQALGISPAQLCDLIYTVNVPNEVNGHYTGMNLGFSSCPGAVKLP